MIHISSSVYKSIYDNSPTSSILRIAAKPDSSTRWSRAEGEWNSKSLNTTETVSWYELHALGFLSGALVKQLLGFSFLDVSLKSEWHVTSDFKYFNSVISVMVSNTVEALIFPQSPRSPYEDNMFSIFLHINRSLKTVLRFVCKRIVVKRLEEAYTSMFPITFSCDVSLIIRMVLRIQLSHTLVPQWTLQTGKPWSSENSSHAKNVHLLRSIK